MTTKLQQVLFSHYEDREMGDGTTIKLPRRIPDEYRAEISFNGLKVTAHAPGHPRYIFRTTMIEDVPIMRRAAERLLIRSCWAVTCLAESGRVADLDPFFPET